MVQMADLWHGRALMRPRHWRRCASPLHQARSFSSNALSPEPARHFRPRATDQNHHCQPAGPRRKSSAFFRPTPWRLHGNRHDSESVHRRRQGYSETPLPWQPRILPFLRSGQNGLRISSAPPPRPGQDFVWFPAGNWKPPTPMPEAVSPNLAAASVH